MLDDMDYNAVLTVSNYLECNLDDNHTGNSSFQSTSIYLFILFYLPH